LISTFIKKLRFVAVEHDKNPADLLTVAINDLLKKYEKRLKK
jgi:hypothetical protein